MSFTVLCWSEVLSTPGTEVTVSVLGTEEVLGEKVKGQRHEELSEGNCIKVQYFNK